MRSSGSCRGQLSGCVMGGGHNHRAGHEQQHLRDVDQHVRKSGWRHRSAPRPPQHPRDAIPSTAWHLPMSSAKHEVVEPRLSCCTAPSTCCGRHGREAGRTRVRGSIVATSGLVATAPLPDQASRQPRPLPHQVARARTLPGARCPEPRRRSTARRRSPRCARRSRGSMQERGRAAGCTRGSGAAERGLFGANVAAVADAVPRCGMAIPARAGCWPHQTTPQALKRQGAD